jgi:tripartite-type tricarboxylate transporter receptor subunit TctC
MKRFRRLLRHGLGLCCAAFLAGLPGSSGAATSDDGYYKGKTIRLIVAFSAGGGYDAYSRAIARHLGKHIPGNPTVVVDNMTGAGGIIHANYMFKQAKPDGLTIGNNSGAYSCSKSWAPRASNSTVRSLNTSVRLPSII